MTGHPLCFILNHKQNGVRLTSALHCNGSPVLKIQSYNFKKKKKTFAVSLSVSAAMPGLALALSVHDGNYFSNLHL